MAVTSNSVTVQWNQQTNLPQGLEDLPSYYGYRLRYRPSSNQQYSEHSSHTHEPERVFLTAEVTDLRCDTSYAFQVEPYREFEGRREYGRPYAEVNATVLCKYTTKYGFEGMYATRTICANIFVLNAPKCPPNLL